MGQALTLRQGENLLRVFEHVYQSSHLIASHCLWGNTGGQLITESSAYARLGASCAENGSLLHSDHAQDKLTPHYLTTTVSSPVTVA